MLELHGIINDKRIIIANSLTQLKRLASRYANNDYRPVDSMIVNVHNVNRCENIEQFVLRRVNKITPNNYITRGQWL